MLNKIIAFAFLIVIVASCSNKKTPNGLEYTMLADSSGENGKIGDLVVFDLIFKNSKDSVIQNTFITGQPTVVEIMQPTYKGCFYEAFQFLSEGDSAVFKVQADSFFLKTLGESVVPKNINPKEIMTFTVKVRKFHSKADLEKERMKQEGSNEERLKVMKEQYSRDSVLIEKYLALNKAKAERTSLGVYIQYTKSIKSNVNLIQGDTVKVRYVGKLLNGTEFDRSRETPFEFVLGTGQVIQGWEEAFLHMKKGEKATIYIPSALGYGDRDMQSIPANSVLIFDVEVVK
jgi:FKBP-type peptidyl-prolyl cis-trans isomerase FkpA